MSNCEKLELGGSWGCQEGDMSGSQTLDEDGRFVSSDIVGVLLWVLFYSKAQVVVDASRGIVLEDFGYIQHTVKQGDLWVGTGTK